MAKIKEPVTIGLGEKAHTALKGLKEQGFFAEMTDGYRFAIALALAHGASVPKLGAGRTTFLNVGSLDPDQSIYEAVRVLREPIDEPIYSTAERLAEWGLTEIAQRVERGDFSVIEILEEVEAHL